MTTWPSGSKATTTHTDSGSDSPRLARVDINQNILNTNDVIDMFNITSPVDRQILQYNTSTAKFELSSDFVGQGLTISNNNITTTRSNDDLVLETSGTGQIVINDFCNFKTNYIEKVFSISATSGSIDVDASVASVHKMTLNDNTTFTFTNLLQGQSVLLIININANSKTATFTSDGSTLVKFPAGAPTLTVASGQIDVVTVFYDGSNYIGNIVQGIQ